MVESGAPRRAFRELLYAINEGELDLAEENNTVNVRSPALAESPHLLRNGRDVASAAGAELAWPIGVCLMHSLAQSL